MAKNKKRKPVFPALAGVILKVFQNSLQMNGFSRTRGGDPKALLEKLPGLLFFPHTRG